MLVSRDDGEEKLVCEKHEGDASGESVLNGFGSSSGSSTDENSDQEEFIAELTRQMAENMLEEDDEKPTISHLPKTNKQRTTHFDPNNVLQLNQHYRHEHQPQRKMKEYGEEISRRGGFLSSASPKGSGMRVVYLGQNGSKPGSSSGTGVFIPHATNNILDHQHRKKQLGRCPTVLIPERVLHTLKQHYEKRNANQPNAAPQYHQNQRLDQQPQEKAIANNDHDHEELRLPQEWTY